MSDNHQSDQITRRSCLQMGSETLVVASATGALMPSHVTNAAGHKPVKHATKPGVKIDWQPDEFRRMVALGESTTAGGWSTSRNRCWVSVLADIYADRPCEIEAANVVMVTSRLPEDALYSDLERDGERVSAAGIKSLRCIGDCHGPATIAAAVYEGHRFARELGDPPGDIAFDRELTELSAEFELP